MIKTRLELHIIHFKEIYKDKEEEKYDIEYSPTDLVYETETEGSPNVEQCNSFIQKYAFSIFSFYNFKDVIDSVLKTINEGKENNTEVVIGFYRKDVSHLDKEVRYDYNGRLFNLKNKLSFNRELNDAEIEKLKTAMIQNFKFNNNSK